MLHIVICGRAQPQVSGTLLAVLCFVFFSLNYHLTGCDVIVSCRLRLWGEKETETLPPPPGKTDESLGTSKINATKKK